MKARLILEDGQIFEGERFGADHDVITEMVFNTGVTGYTELLTDPSYAGQGVVMASPIIGNYGVFEEDQESARPWLDAFVVRYITSLEEDPREATDLDAYLKKHNVPGLTGVDTRFLTLTIREKGTMKGLLTGEMDKPAEAYLDKIRDFICVSKVPEVSIRQKRKYVGGDLGKTDRKVSTSLYSRTAPGSDRFKVALMDFGAKSNITRLLWKHGCSVVSYPWNATAEEILGDQPDGIMLSNGPGDPKECQSIIAEIRKLYDSGIPIFGICLGHQLMALAMGFDTYKLKYGHRGINHTVKDLDTGRCYITSQNHSYSVDGASIDPAIAYVSHININDSSIEGLKYKGRNVFTVQFHPEGAPGPMDTEFLFDEFTQILEGVHQA
ncbi:MAG: carbamoyl phosphate synthase small subunit [Saccharofermentanales bacterium]